MDRGSAPPKGGPEGNKKGEKKEEIAQAIINLNDPN
jgi:hypothetical protein